MKQFSFLFSLFVVFGISTFAQENSFDASKIPAVGSKSADFAPAGWKVESEIAGDLNGDGKTDAAFKLAQIATDPDKESGVDGDRALVIVFSDGDRWKRVATAAKLLQCTGCGGAFYGVMPAPAAVQIEKGILIVENEHGSRNVSRSNFRFRYEAKSGRFRLIGYEFADYDRADGSTSNESTNYSTNSRIQRKSKGKRSSTRRSVIKPTKIYIEDADGDEIEGQALKRLGLG